MPPEEAVLEAARAWLSRAVSALELVEQGKPVHTVWEDMCFNAQQAAEKALKAVLVFYQIDFPKTHAIEDLVQLLEKAGHSVPTQVAEAGDLTDYAVETRYPFPRSGHLVAEEEFNQALVHARNVIHWAEGIIGRKPTSS